MSFSQIHTQPVYDGLRLQLEKAVDISSEEWSMFRKHWEYQEISKGTVLTAAGSTEDYFYYVHKGIIRGYALNNGDDITIGFSYDGDYSGAYDSMLSRTPSEWYIEAISDALILRIHHENLSYLFDHYKFAERWGRIFNANILIGMSRRQLEARSFTAEEKYKRLLENSPGIFQLASQKHIASYLGMKPETLSRLRKKKR